MSDYLNKYSGIGDDIPRDVHLKTPRGEYDQNFVFPVQPLTSDRIQLRPFVPSEHAQLLFEGLQKYPEISRWMSVSVPEDIGDVLVFIEKMRRNPSIMFFAIFTGPLDSNEKAIPPEEYTFAGAFAFLESSALHKSIEPGYIWILPPFQRTHVLTHTLGLVLHKTLDLPKDGGWGLRRVQWTTTTLNTASQNAALRLGFKEEGVLRSYWALPPGKKGARAGRQGTNHANNESRDNWFASIIWTEWEESVREHIDKLMARR